MTTRTTPALLIQPGSIIASAGGWVGEETWRAGAERNEEVTRDQSWVQGEVVEVGRVHDDEISHDDSTGGEEVWTTIINPS